MHISQNSMSSNLNDSEPPAKIAKTARVVTNHHQQQQEDGEEAIVPKANGDDREEQEETPAVVNKLTECVEFDRDAEVCDRSISIAPSACT